MSCTTPAVSFYFSVLLVLAVLLWASGSPAADPRSRSDGDEAQGTAFKIADGIWLTARHVAVSCKAMTIENGEAPLRVERWVLNAQSDIALLLTQPVIGIAALNFSQRLPETGEVGLMHGYPQNQGFDLKQRYLGERSLRVLVRGKKVKHKVSYWAEIKRHPRSAPIDLGRASGAPVLDSTGGIVGLHIASIPRRGRTFSVPPGQLKAFVQSEGVGKPAALIQLRDDHDAALAWLVNGAELRAFKTIARVQCFLDDAG
ncbi:serine protease [Pseudomonadales bacterium]|nr:serine protease [Pseudomonadales bacterium]